MYPGVENIYQFCSMCFHNSVVKPREEIEAAFNARFAEPQAFHPVFHGNGFTFMRWPVITAAHPDIIRLYHWGLIPFWCKSLDEANEIRKHTLNAMSETAWEKPSFRNSVKRKRCLVLSSGFFEWRTIGKNKYPYYIQLRSRELFAMAGLYDEFTDMQTGELLQTFTILTCAANPLLQKIHNSKKRMPVILTKEQETRWMQSEMNKEEFLSITQPYDAEDMKAHTISKRITSRTEDTNVPEVLNEFIYEELKD
jgi:putative SOS response-associated peptidase YedK